MVRQGHGHLRGPIGLKNRLIEMTIAPTSAVVSKRLLDLGLPKETFIILLGRRGGGFVPDGGTVLEGSEVLLVSTDHESSAQLRDIFEDTG